MSAHPATLPGLLEAAAARDPERVALRSGYAQVTSQVTYGALNALADVIAHALLVGGVRRGDRVGIHLAKSIEAIASVYGAMKVGAAYVPMDRKSPASRVAGIADNCEIQALLTEGEPGKAVLAAMATTPAVVLEMDAGWAEREVARAPAAGGGELPEVKAEDVAYILFTSGSTGVPKGVVLSHANAMAFVAWAAGHIGVGADDRLSSHAPLHFDLSIFDLYVAAFAGATLVLVPEAMTAMGADLVAFVEREQITTWYSVPSALVLMTRAADGPAPLASLRTVVFAGEVYPLSPLRALRALVPDAALWNFYGPTETNVCTYLAVRDLPPEDDTPLTIGRACENGTEAFVVTSEGTVAGVGVEGELFVTGPTVMRGYWGMPERDAEVLVQDPRAEDGSGGRCYRTGDIVRELPDGTFEFRGRRDHQVKSRGYRIELGEIETSLHAHPDVTDSAAVAIAHEEWGTAVIGCVVLREGAQVREIDLRRHISKDLPRYMVPARVDVLEALPRTTNGKVDRQRLAALAAALPAPGVRARQES